MHQRKPHAPERRVSACYAKLFTAPSRTQPPASLTPTCNPWAQPPVATAPNPRAQTHSPTNAATDHRLPSGLVNFEDLWIEVLGDLLHLKHKVQTTASTTLFTELQEFQGLLPGCYNIHDQLTDLLRDLLLQQAFLRHHPVNLRHLRCTRKSSAFSTFQCLTALLSVGATPLLTFDIVLVRSTLFLLAVCTSLSLLLVAPVLVPNIVPNCFLAACASPWTCCWLPVPAGPWRSWGQDAPCCLCLQLILQLCLAFSSLLGGERRRGKRGEEGRKTGSGLDRRRQAGASQAGATTGNPKIDFRGYGRRSRSLSITTLLLWFQMAMLVRASQTANKQTDLPVRITNFGHRVSLAVIFN